MVKLNITHAYESLQDCKTQEEKWHYGRKKNLNARIKEDINAERISINVQRIKQTRTKEKKNKILEKWRKDKNEKKLRKREMNE